MTLDTCRLISDTKLMPKYFKYFERKLSYSLGLFSLKKSPGEIVFETSHGAPLDAQSAIQLGGGE